MKIIKAEQTDFKGAVNYYLTKFPNSQKAVKKIFQTEDGMEELFQSKIEEIIFEQDEKEADY